MILNSAFRRIKIKLFNWEYWPWPLVYVPVLLQYIFHSLLLRTFTFPALINRPYMKHGGIFEESKWEMYKNTPKGLMPLTAPLSNFNSTNDLLNWLKEHQLSYPLILKPDRGMRGSGISIACNAEELVGLINNLPFEFNYLVQEYTNYPNEIGAFMVFNPISNQWKLSSLMLRNYLSVKGNGKSNIKELILKNDRAFLQFDRLKALNFLDFKAIPEKDESVVLERIGNHSRGTLFADGNHLIKPKLEQALSNIAKQLQGFEYGRMDIKFKSWKDLEELKDFKIIEVNGANSEPAHIYDPNNSIFFAWRELLRHHRLLFKLAKKAKKNNSEKVSHAYAWSLFKSYNKLMRLN